MNISTCYTFPLQLRWLLVAYTAISIIYLWSTPLFEASDELWHFGMVEYIRQHHSLPVQDPDNPDTPWRQEGSQPPLYYALAAALTLPFDLSDIDSFRQPNPHAKIGIPGADDNKNMVLHGELVPPLQNTALAVYVVRIFGILLGAVTVTAVYLTARQVGGELVAVIAAGLTALNPMFLFISASVNNDNLVTALNSVVILLTLQLLQHGFSTRRSLLIAVLLALASLSKLSGLVLIPVVAFVGLWVAYQRRHWRGLVVLGGLVAGIWLVLAGWWYARNLTLYDELFGTGTMVDVAGPRLDTFTLGTLLDEFEGFRMSYWGLFGAVNIMTVPWFYRVMDAVTILAVLGVIVYVWQRRFVVLVLLSIVGGSWLSVIHWTAQTYASQGRLLFPFVAANCTLLALGLVQVAAFGRRHSMPLRAGVVCLGVFALFVPVVSIVPRYAVPRAVLAVPGDVIRVFARYRDMTLVGYQTPDRLYKPGDTVPVTLYWQPIAPSQQDYSMYLHLLDGQGQEIGKLDTYPGGGRLRTSTWIPGEIYADSYHIKIKDNVSGSFELRMLVGWWHYPTQVTLLPRSEAGQDIGSVVLNIGGVAAAEIIDTASFIQLQPVAFGDVILLEGYQLHENQLRLLWHARNDPHKPYTVFAQVLDARQSIVAQGDAPPALPTRYWQKDQWYTTVHTLNYHATLLEGQYRLLIGWYDPVDFARLKTNYPNDAYELTHISVRVSGR